MATKFFLGLCMVAVAFSQTASMESSSVEAASEVDPSSSEAAPVDSAAVEAASVETESVAVGDEISFNGTPWTVIDVIWVALAGAVLAMIFAFGLAKWLVSQEDTNAKVQTQQQIDEMRRIAKLIDEGARDFLKTEYKALAVFCLITAIILFFLFHSLEGVSSGLRYAVCFLIGALLSAYAGWTGMAIATKSNIRTTNAASKPTSEGGGLPGALKIAFRGGAVMGFTVVGLGLLGLVGMFGFMTLAEDQTENIFVICSKAMVYMTGFGFGASSIALFARVAGGCYTKAADVGADLVGKVEEDLNEDDPSNPAVIADNVGDNVGDVAGMGADLFESYVGSIIAASTLASNMAEFAFPLWIAGGGVVCAMIGTFFVKTTDGASQKSLLWSLKNATFIASALVVAMTAGFVHLFDLSWGLFGSTLAGLIGGIIIGEGTEYATSYAYGPTRSISMAGKTGPATVIIQGLGIGMLSCAPPVIVVVIVILACAGWSGGYGIAISAVGMLSTLGVTLATDAYGPVADNAGGIAEMSHLPAEVRSITDNLDALGNTTAATGKGFAIGSAVLTALSLLASFKLRAGLGGADTITDIADPIVLAGVLLGAVLPFVFAALTMLSVRKAATSIILEVRRQFFSLDLKNGGTPDYEKCIRIATTASLEEMILPGALAILVPVTVGFLVGPRCLTGVLSGAIASGFMMAVMMSNAGGAWDNAKKYQEIELKAKGSEVHKATVVGDTVGDPFKDTSGPALNILIKLMCMVSLLLAPLLKVDDWATVYYGLIPLALTIIITAVVYMKYWANFEADTEAQHRKLDAQKAASKSASADDVNVHVAETKPLKA